MRLIADGVVDRECVPGLASRLRVSERQLRRLLGEQLGTGPVALARAQRASTARLLIDSTSLPFTDVAFAAGFRSVRQFNETVRAVFAATPSELRRRANGAGPRPPGIVELRPQLPGTLRRNRTPGVPQETCRSRPRGSQRRNVPASTRPPKRHPAWWT